MPRKSGAPQTRPRPPAASPSAEWEGGLGAFAAASVDAFVLFDENLNVVGMNPAAARLAELSREPSRVAIGKNILDHAPGTKDSPRYAEYLRVLETGEPYQADVVAHDPKLGKKHLTVKAFKTGKGLGIIASDITERKTAEEALRQSRDRYHSVFDNARDGIVLVDFETGDIVDCNPEFERQTGRTLDQLTSMKIWEIRPPDKVAEARTMFRHVKDNGAGSSAELDFHRPTGDIVPIEFKASVVTIGDRKYIQSVARDITERKKAEEVLKETAAKWQSLLDNAPNLIAILDRDGVFQFVNRTIPGVTVEQVVGTRTYDYVPAEFHDMIEGKIEHVFQTGEPIHYELRGLGPHGEERWYESWVGPLSMDERVAYVTQISSDITERKQAEQQRLLSLNMLERLNRGGELRELIRDVLALVKDFSGCEAVGIRLKEGDDFPYFETRGFPGGFVEAERSLCARDLDGQPLRDEMGNPVLECMCGNIIRGRFDPKKPFFTPGGSFWTNSTSDLLASTTEQDRQARTRNRCNGEGYESVALVPLKWEGRIAGLLQLNDTRRNHFTSDLISYFEGIGQSIGLVLERERAEEALRESEDMLRSIFRAAPVGIGVVSNRVLLWTNDRMSQMTGYSREELAGQSAKMLYDTEEEFHRVGTVKYAQIAELGTGTTETRLRRKDGTAFDVLLSSTPLDLSDLSAGVTFTALDITERKQAEEVLRDHSRRLEEVVQSRTKELLETQAQLVSEEKLAALGQLAGGVGHELRNPLGAIKNAAYFLNMVLESPDQEVKETLDILEREVANSERIIGSLFDFGLQKPPSRSKVDLNAVVRAALSRVGVPENTEVVSELDEALPEILADPDQLGQVFRNIILNAIQAMPDGGRLAIKSATPDRGWVAVSLADTGAGMSVETLLRVFEPLFTTKAKGIGLGLAHSKTLVDGHGGTIEAQSELGQGSTFTVRLPVS